MSKRVEEQLRRKEELRRQREEREAGAEAAAGAIVSTASSEPSPALLTSATETPASEVTPDGSPAPTSSGPEPSVGDRRTAGAATRKITEGWERGLAAQLEAKTREAEDLAAVVDDLKKHGVEWKILPVEPDQVDVVGFNRFKSTFDARQDNSFRDLLENIIAVGGNKQPGMVRPSPTDPNRFHLVFGERRLRACQQAGLPFSAIVAELGDTDAWLYREVENFGRKDKGVLETALGLADMPERFAYGERSTVLAKLKISPVHYHRLKSIAAVPVAVWEVIPSAHLATQREAVRVAEAYKLDPKAVVARSKRVKPTLGRGEAIDTLCGTSKSPPPTNWARVQRKGPSVQVSVVSASEESAQELEKEIREWLESRGLTEPRTAPATE